jgi:hypothetical protein
MSVPFDHSHLGILFTENLELSPENARSDKLVRMLETRQNFSGAVAIMLRGIPGLCAPQCPFQRKLSYTGIDSEKYEFDSFRMLSNSPCAESPSPTPSYLIIMHEQSPRQLHCRTSATQPYLNSHTFPFDTSLS